MKKVLLLQEYLPHYRVDVFNELAKNVDLTVVYSKGRCPDGVKFRTILMKSYKIHWKFHNKNLYLLAQKFDIVLCMFDPSYIDYRMLSFLPHKYKIIYWGTGVLFDKDSRYDGDKNTHPALINAMKRADATIFYCDYPKTKYSNLGIDHRKLFVANNTVSVLPINENLKKKNILFIGTLYKNKGIEELLLNYFAAYQIDTNIPDLYIVGEGSEYENIKKLIDIYDLNSKVFLEGGVYDESRIRDYFSSSYVCISPNQAGLSVLKSMGYGVPFVTIKNAITGGELFNIKHGENGLLIESFSEIKDIILDVATDRSKFLLMGEKAMQHYYSNRKVVDMVNGFLKAIEYVN